MRHNSQSYDRRRFLRTLGLGAAGLPFAYAELFRASARQRLQRLYVGTYTTGTASDGIYIYQLDTAAAKLDLQKTVKGVVDPSFLTVARRSPYLYAVNETLEYEGQKSGAVSSFSINRRTGDLTFLNRQPSMGGAPCYVSISKNDRYVLVANYVGGNLAVFPIGNSGVLGSAVDVIQHEGSGPNKERQESAHAHWVDLDKSGHLAAACDLGADKIFLYRFDDRSGKLQPHRAQPFITSKPGAGPRHLAFHPNGRFAFVVNELNSTISTLAFDRDRGTFTETQSVPTLPAGWTGENTCAEIQISPSGNFLYGSNRGHDSIVSFRVDENTGRLSFLEHTPTGGKGPRNFIIDPTGRVLLVANQRSDNIVLFAVDWRSGKLQPTGNTYQVPSPVCLKLISAIG